MNFSSHLIGGTIAAGAVAGYMLYQYQDSFYTAVFAGGATWLGAQFPDLDVGSIPARWFGRIGALAVLILSGYGVLAQAPGLLLISSAIGFLALCMHGMKHRGPTHKYWFPLILFAAAYLVGFQGILYPLMLVGFGIGIYIHLLLDGIFPWQIRKAWLF